MPWQRCFFACFLLSVYFISDLGKDFAWDYLSGYGGNTKYQDSCGVEFTGWLHILLGRWMDELGCIRTVGGFWTGHSFCLFFLTVCRSLRETTIPLFFLNLTFCPCFSDCRYILFFYSRPSSAHLLFVFDLTILSAGKPGSQRKEEKTSYTRWEHLFCCSFATFTSTHDGFDGIWTLWAGRKE